MHTPRSIVLSDAQWYRVRSAALEDDKSASAWIRDLIIKELDRRNVVAPVSSISETVAKLREEFETAKHAALEAQIKGATQNEFTRLFENVDRAHKRLKLAERAAR